MMEDSSTENADLSWEHVEADPHLEHDMGYCLQDWDVFHASQNGEEQVLFLPPESEALRDDAFIVASSRAVVDPYRHR